MTSPTEAALVQSRNHFRFSTWPFLLVGVLLVLAGLALYLVGTVLVAITFVIGRTELIGLLLPYWVLPAGALFLLGTALCLIDLFLLLPLKRQQRLVSFERLPNRKVTVALTAYNDEQSIGDSVRDFLSHPMVRRVIVVDNNSRDRTSEVASGAGAIVVLEPLPGYGKCVYRALKEGLSYADTDLTLLCEGDMTFRAFDLDKFLSYVPHAEIVNGTRIVEQLRDEKTQLTTFMYYGNFFVGKLLEAKHIGKGTFTDVGTTYKLCRNAALTRLLPMLDSTVNLEFNAHFLDVALRNGVTLVECPITFHQRVGLSKGGNTNDLRALKVGLRMMAGIIFGWAHIR
jgi:Glycosyl transferase family 2